MVRMLTMITIMIMMNIIASNFVITIMTFTIRMITPKYWPIIILIRTIVILCENMCVCK